MSTVTIHITDSLRIFLKTWSKLCSKLMAESHWPQGLLSAMFLFMIFFGGEKVISHKKIIIFKNLASSLPLSSILLISNEAYPQNTIHIFLSILSATILINVHILWITSYLAAFAFGFFLQQSIILYINLSQINCLTYQFYHATDQHLLLLSSAFRSKWTVFGFIFKVLHSCPQCTFITLFPT